ncbi:hypothetical protein P5673_001708 [Acropora cervicornis]|uniref:Uncharacterized protein n=1 Tax=Acropora cervicornis TaxID=6130 RepID=A0AAD9R414_ACRCE|nr:hypothetical protein P5673_001708 [Acropora cervicornis]
MAPCECLVKNQAGAPAPHTPNFNLISLVSLLSYCHYDNPQATQLTRKRSGNGPMAGGRKVRL